MWLLAPGGNWVEMGNVKGYTAPDGVSTTQYWAGHYYAKQRTNGTNPPIYQRILFGVSGVTGAHSFQIEKTGSSGGLYSWSFALNNVNQGGLSSNNASFPYMQGGIETNNGLSKFRSGTTIESMYYRDTANVWKAWPTTGVVDGDNLKIPSWNSVYDGANRRITFYTSQ